jgi:hypothetical protein
MNKNEIKAMKEKKDMHGLYREPAAGVSRTEGISYNSLLSCSLKV